MKKPFKKGDKVICIAIAPFDSDTRNFCKIDELIIGATYTVSSCTIYKGGYADRIPCIEIKGKDYEHKASNFKLKSK